MSKLDNIRNDINTRSKSLLTCVADILEDVTEQSLAFSSDFAGFAVAQVRLPTQADDFSDYRSRSKDAIVDFGGTVKEHGKEMISVLREVPQQLKSALAEEAQPVKKVAKKTAKKVAKKAPKKASTAKSAAAKKAA